MIIYPLCQYINQKRIKFRTIPVFKRDNLGDIDVYGNAVCTPYLTEIMIKIWFSFPSIFVYKFKHKNYIPLTINS